MMLRTMRLSLASEFCLRMLLPMRLNGSSSRVIARAARVELAEQGSETAIGALAGSAVGEAELALAGRRDTEQGRAARAVGTRVHAGGIDRRVARVIAADLGEAVERKQ